MCTRLFWFMRNLGEFSRKVILLVDCNQNLYEHMVCHLKPHLVFFSNTRFFPLNTKNHWQWRIIYSKFSIPIWFQYTKNCFWSLIEKFFWIKVEENFDIERYLQLTKQIKRRHNEQEIWLFEQCLVVLIGFCKVQLPEKMFFGSGRNNRQGV